MGKGRQFVEIVISVLSLIATIILGSIGVHYYLKLSGNLANSNSVQATDIGILQLDLRTMQDRLDTLERNLRSEVELRRQQESRIEKRNCSTEQDMQTTQRPNDCVSTLEWASTLKGDLQSAMCSSNKEVNVSVSNWVKDVGETCRVAIEQINRTSSEAFEQLTRTSSEVIHKMNMTNSEQNEKIERFLHEGFGLVTSEESPECGIPGYYMNPFSGACYRLVPTSVSWYVAKTACEDAGEFLLSFQYVEEARWFRAFQLIQGGRWTDNQIWIALRYFDTGFQWEGKQTGYLGNTFTEMWLGGQPDAPYAGFCVYTDATSRYAGYWLDSSCTGKQYFVCQRP